MIHALIAVAFIVAFVASIITLRTAYKDYKANKVEAKAKKNETKMKEDDNERKD